MKNKLFFLFISLFIFSGAMAQTQFLGIRGGVNLANVSQKNLGRYTDMKPGFAGGLEYEIQLKDKFSVGSSLLYSQQGFKSSFIVTDKYGHPLDEHEMTNRYNYVSLPLTLGIITGKSLKFIPKIGLQPSVLVSASATVPQFDNENQFLTNETIDLTERVDKFDLAGLIGFEARRQIIPETELFASVTWKYSITAFTNEDYLHGQQYRHNLFEVSLGIKYRIKGS